MYCLCQAIFTSSRNDITERIKKIQFDDVVFKCNDNNNNSSSNNDTYENAHNNGMRHLIALSDV